MLSGIHLFIIELTLHKRNQLFNNTLGDPTGGGYKYLGILENDKILTREMKEHVSALYKKRLKLLLKTKLNARNLITAINSWAVAVVRYSAGFLDWTKEEMDILDRMTRKALTMNGGAHPKADVDRLYLRRKVGGRGLISVAKCVELERLNLDQQ